MRKTVLVGIAALNLALWPAEAPAAPSQVSIEAVSVSPSGAGPNVLCGLSVVLKNAGAHTATDFHFKVRIGGEEATVYGAETFAVNVAPGTSETITLHNFWTPAVPNPKLAVEVSILEGRWADVKKDASVTTTTPIGPIDGLPVSATQTVHMAAK
jgi:hypothetical protein